MSYFLKSRLFYPCGRWSDKQQALQVLNERWRHLCYYYGAAARSFHLQLSVPQKPSFLTHCYRGVIFRDRQIFLWMLLRWGWRRMFHTEVCRMAWGRTCGIGVIMRNVIYAGWLKECAMHVGELDREIKTSSVYHWQLSYEIFRKTDIIAVFIRASSPALTTSVADVNFLWRLYVGE